MSTSSRTTGVPQRQESVLAPSIALLWVELLAGMQTYLSETVLPLVASDLDGRRLYGVLGAASQAPMFLMMPIGAWMLTRFPLGRLMLGFTLLTVAGATICATAATMPAFAVGTAVRALAGGALATIGMGAISRGLPQRYRQLVLAGMSGVWVVSSVVGPVYAVAVSTTIGWRWAMVLYLPLLLAARFVIARHVPEKQPTPDAERAPWVGACVLALGAVLLAVPVGRWSPLLVAAGAALLLAALWSLLPDSLRRARRGPLVSPGALGFVAATYFGATTVLSVVAVDTFGLTPAQFGVVIAAPGFTWALAGLWCGTHPALDDPRFGRRAVPAVVVLVAGVGGILAAVTVAGSGDHPLSSPRWPAPRDSPGLGWARSTPTCSVGRSTSALRLPTGLPGETTSTTAVSQDQVAGAVVLTESVGMALTTTTAYAWLGTGFGIASTAAARSEVLYLILLGVGVVAVLAVAASAAPSRR